MVEAGLTFSSYSSPIPLVFAG